MFGVRELVRGVRKMMFGVRELVRGVRKMMFGVRELVQQKLWSLCSESQSPILRCFGVCFGCTRFPFSERLFP